MRSKRDLINRRKTGFPIQVAAVVIWGAVNRVWVAAMEENAGRFASKVVFVFSLNEL
jgi:hypothetical protein